MDELNLLLRPTVETLIEEDDIDAGNEDGLLYEQGFRSEPGCVQEGETFDIPEGIEAIPDDCECFLTGEKNDVPESLSVLSTGHYLYKGAGVIQRLG